MHYPYSLPFNDRLISRPDLVARPYTEIERRTKTAKAFEFGPCLLPLCRIRYVRSDCRHDRGQARLGLARGAIPKWSITRDACLLGGQAHHST